MGEPSQLERAEQRVLEGERALERAEAELADARSRATQGPAFRDGAQARLAAAEGDRARAAKELEQARAELEAFEQDPLGKLARRGRQRQQAASRQREESAALRARRQSRDAERSFVLASTPWGFFGTFGGRVVMGLLLFFSLAAIFYLSTRGRMRGGPAALIVVWGGLIAAALLTIPLQRAVLVVARRAAARERSWVAALPFKLVGYEELLGKTFLSDHLRVVVRFESPLGKQTALVRDAARGVSGVREVEADQEKLVLTLGVEGTAARNAYWRRPVHRIVDELVLPLHQRQPLRAVELESW